MVSGDRQKWNIPNAESECVLVKMGRKPCCAKQGLNKGAWSVEEDKILINYIQVHGDGKWRDLPQKAGLKRCGKSCRLRWLNYLRPDITRGNISVEEEQLINKLHDLLGNRWSLIAGRLPGRTDNEIKNYWNTNLRKRLKGDHDKKRMPQHESKKNECSKNITANSNSEERKPEPPRVFRTKAFRCTKVVTPGLVDCNQSVDNVGDNSQSSSALQEDTNSVSDLVMDFNVSELLVSNALSSAVSFQANEIDENGDHVDGDPYHHGLINSMSCFTEYSDSAHEAMFEDLIMDEHRRPDYWTDGDPFQNNDLMDLKSLEFFLISEDELC